MGAEILSPFVRILLRWVGGFLIAKGYAVDAATFADPELVASLCYFGAGLCAVVSEGWWLLARKRGWAR